MFSNEQWAGLRSWHTQQRLQNPREWFHSVQLIEGRSRWQWLLAEISKLGGDDVVRGKSKVQAGKSGQAKQWTQFVDIPLGETNWDDIWAVYGTSVQLDAAVAELLSEGYRMGLSYNPQNDAVICSITAKGEDNPNEGKTFTAFAGSWVEALQVALYKHNQIAGKDWDAAAHVASGPRFG